MKISRTCLLAILTMFTGDTLTLAQTATSTINQPSAPTTAALATNAAAPANPAAPPSAPAQRSDADLDKLVAPIALYPDPLLATVLPASAYPLEIVQAARFVKDTNNIAKLDSQSWDDNVKAVARFPDVIKQMDDNLQWTSDLGDAFINQPKGVTDAIQRMRTKAQSSGALKTTQQQVVNVTNTVVTNIVESKTVIVTNQVVQIQPSQPDVIYVPQYNPTVVYAGYPVAYPGYVYPPYYPVAGAAVSFGLGMAAGAIIANNCDWGHGGCWGGSYHSDVNINRNVNVNNNFNRNNINNVNRQNTSVNNRQKWQPDQNRIKNSGSTLSSAQSREARGYGSGAGANRSTAASQRASAAQNLSASERSYPNRSGSATPRASSTPNRTASTTPRSGSADSRLSPTGPSGNRPSSESFNRPSSQGANRPSSSESFNRPSSSQSFNRPSPSDSSRSAFSGGGSASTRAASSRGSMSRGGGGGRGGGGRR